MEDNIYVNKRPARYHFYDNENRPLCFDNKVVEFTNMNKLANFMVVLAKSRYSYLLREIRPFCDSLDYAGGYIDGDKVHFIYHDDNGEFDIVDD